MTTETAIVANPEEDTTEDLNAEQALALGDSLYTDEEYGAAVDAYAAGLLVVHRNDLAKFRLQSHRSAAFYQLGRYQEALEDAQAACELVGSSSLLKGLRTGETEVCSRRQGLAAFRLGKYEDAKKIFESARQLATLNKREVSSYEDWIQQCVDKIEGKTTTKTKSSSNNKENKGDTQSATASSTAASSKESRPITPKYQYYQSDKVMTIAILEPNVKQQDLTVNFERDRLSVVLRKEGMDLTVVGGALYDEVDVDNCRVQIRDEKVLIKLRKRKHAEWYELMAKPKKGASSKESTSTKPSTDAPPKPASELKEIPKVDTSKPRPYASHRDWDKIEKTVAEEEEEEGDAAAKLFKMIYANADEDTRRAMVKSYQTSGGTVLSTNWSEVAKTDYEKERQAPDGQEWKTWEGEKLPMKKEKK